MKLKILTENWCFLQELGQRGRLKQGNEIEGGHSWQENGINKGTEVRMFMRMGPCRT